MGLCVFYMNIMKSNFSINEIDDKINSLELEKLKLKLELGTQTNPIEELTHLDNLKINKNYHKLEIEKIHFNGRDEMNLLSYHHDQVKKYDILIFKEIKDVY